MDGVRTRIAGLLGEFLGRNLPDDLLVFSGRAWYRECTSGTNAAPAPPGSGARYADAVRSGKGMNCRRSSRNGGARRRYWACRSCRRSGHRFSTWDRCRPPSSGRGSCPWDRRRRHKQAFPRAPSLPCAVKDRTWDRVEAWPCFLPDLNNPATRPCLETADLSHPVVRAAWHFFRA